MLADLLRRAEQTSRIDGMPRGVRGEPVSGGEPHSDPTGGAVLALQATACERCGASGTARLKDGRPVTCWQCHGSGRRFADPVADAVAEIVVELSKIIAAAARIDDRCEVVLGPERERRGREPSLGGMCWVCGKVVAGTEADRLRAKMCKADYLAWTAWKLRTKPSDDPASDRRVFTTWQREKRGVDGAQAARIDRLALAGQLPPMTAEAR